MSTSPENGDSNVSVSTAIVISFNKTIKPNTLTTNIENTSCSGSVQLSENSFSSCIQMSASPVASDGNKSFTVNPLSNLALSTSYTLRLTSQIKDEENRSIDTTIINFSTANTVLPTDMIFWITDQTHNGDFATEGGGSARVGADSFCANDTNKPDGFSNYHGILEISENDTISQMYDNFSLTNGRIMHLGGLLKLWDNFTYIDNATFSSNNPYSEISDNITWLGRAARVDDCYSMPTRNFGYHCRNWSYDGGLGPGGRGPYTGAVLYPGRMGSSGALCAPTPGSENVCNVPNKLSCIAVP